MHLPTLSSTELFPANTGLSFGRRFLATGSKCHSPICWFLDPATTYLPRDNSQGMGGNLDSVDTGDFVCPRHGTALLLRSNILEHILLLAGCLFPIAGRVAGCPGGYFSEQRARQASLNRVLHTCVSTEIETLGAFLLQPIGNCSISLTGSFRNYSRQLVC